MAQSQDLSLVIKKYDGNLDLVAKLNHLIENELF